MAEGVQFSRYLGKRAASMAEYAPDPLEVVAAHLGMLVGQLIKLDANENPFGPSRRALQAIIGYNAWQEYPDPISRQLRSAIGSSLRVDAARVMVGNGSDELIDQIVTLFRPEAGVGGIREVLSFPPTFGMYKHYTAVNDMQLVEIPRDSAFQLDMAAIERLCSDGQPRLCFVASPNNPDGQLLPKSTLTRLLGLPLLVVLDEAYVEFSERSAVALTKATIT